jgi:branched-chain amino acid transport system permease protein
VPARWGSGRRCFIAAVLVGVLGALVELTGAAPRLCAPELFQLLATFALVLVLKDAALWMWGPKTCWARGARSEGARCRSWAARCPSYDLLLIFVGPVVLGLMWLLLHRTRWGTLVRAATQDREMLSAPWASTRPGSSPAVFALGSMLAGLGGALQLPREPASLAWMTTIGEAFVVVVVGGMGSLPGAYLAALLIGEIKALCTGLGTVQLFGLDLSFSASRWWWSSWSWPWCWWCGPGGCWGAANRPPRTRACGAAPCALMGRWQWWIGGAVLLLLALLPELSTDYPYATVLAIDMLVAVLFAASLHVIMGPAGLHSFGHAAYFGLGAYGAALLVLAAGWPMVAAMAGAPVVAGLGALLVGWFCVRLSGVYFAMLTLAFAQIAWSVVFQWDGFTGGSNGLTGVWPAPWLADKHTYYYLTLVLVVAAVGLLRRIVFSPFGLAMRAVRDSPLRAQAIGIPVARVQWVAFVIAGSCGGLAGALFVFSKGSVSPDSLGIGRSVDALVMVLLGGVQSLWGPVFGAVSFSWMQDSIARSTDYWRAVLGATMLVLVLLLPQGIAGLRLQLGQLAVRMRRSMGARGRP